MTTYKAIFGGDSVIEYSFDGSKAWIAQRAGRTLRWAAGDTAGVWYGYRTAADRTEGGGRGNGSIARILDHTHPEFE